METRLVMAYALIVLVALFGVAVIAYNAYHSNRRTYIRRLRREDRAYSEKMRAKDEQSQE